MHFSRKGPWCLVAGLAIVLMLAGPAFAQEGSAAGLQAKTQELQRQLAAQRAQNQMLERQLQQLSEAVAGLTKTQAAQGEKIKQLPGELKVESRVKPIGKENIFIKGFISSSFYMQDQDFAFGNGQNAEFPKPPEFEHNRWFAGGDVRNTRLDIGFKGPKLQGWNAGGLIESDFFGGFNGSGPFSHQQAHLRLRLGYIQLTKGQTKIRMGQDWSPLFGEWPISTSHIAFPLGYGSGGYVRWRFPGIYLWQGLNGKDAPVKVQLQAGVFEGSWNGPGSPIATLSAGNVSFRPQVEARLNFSGKTSAGYPWKVYIVGHWDEKDLRGVNNVVANPAIDDKITGTAEEIGGKIKIGRFLIHGNIYQGNGIGQQFAAITQFGDISTWGGWMQLGYDLTKHWSLYGFYGVDDPDDQDVLTWVGNNGRVKNEMYNVHLRYAVGPYWFGIEWLHDTLETGPDATETTGNQIALSALYKF